MMNVTNDDKNREDLNFALYNNLVSGWGYGDIDQDLVGNKNYQFLIIIFFFRAPG